MIRRLLLPLCFFFSIGLTTRQLGLAAAASSSKVVTTLPGFNGLLPFHLETGYVEVDEVNGVELFYYFVRSEAGGKDAPFLLWLTGGDHCSVLSGLALEIGPFQFVMERYNGTVPSIEINPYSWTKVANILFVDSPVGAGFSFSRKPEGYAVGDVSSSLQLHALLIKIRKIISRKDYVVAWLNIKWFTDHPEFLANPLYIGGDSYGGKIAPVVTQKISEGVEAGRSPLLNLKGYLVGNPTTGDIIDYSAGVPYAHGVGIISDQLYETIIGHCHGEDYRKPTNALCAQGLDTYRSLLSEVRWGHILLDNCGGFEIPELDSSAGAGWNMLSEETRFKNTPPSPTLDCQTYGIYLSYFWANDESTRDALGIKDGTVEEWVRCRNGDVPYTMDISSSIKYHRNVTINGYRALVYSGDHDAGVPHQGTQAWVRSLGFSVVDEWRAWHLDGQSAGFTMTYANNMTFATVKGAGHTAPEFAPERCFAMFSRWILNQQI